MKRVIAVSAAMLLFVSPASSWRNGGESTQNGTAKFGTHDYIALKGYELGGIADLPWITENLNVYFLGTEAPDVGPKIAGVANGYHDTGACQWRDAFRNQTGENVNYSANAIAKLLKMI
jgi:hypothetical protein